MNNRILLTFKLLSLLIYSSGAMANSMANISVGYEQTTGDYGLNNDTEITTIPLTVQYAQDAWRFRLNIHYISVTGDGSILPGSMGTISSDNLISLIGPGGPSMPGATTSVVETQSGLGDITTSVSYAFPPDNNSNMFYELTAEIKWGTASASKNLGTGQNDYSLSLYSMYEKHALKPFLSVGYLFMGDRQFVDYNDVLFTTAGLMYQMNPQTFFSVAYDYQQATSDGRDDGHMAGLYATRQFSGPWSANVYLLKGLSDSVADSGAGFTLIHSY